MYSMDNSQSSGQYHYRILIVVPKFAITNCNKVHPQQHIIEAVLMTGTDYYPKLLSSGTVLFESALLMAMHGDLSHDTVGRVSSRNFWLGRKGCGTFTYSTPIKR